MPAQLEVDHVTTGYGKVEVLHDVSLAVPPGSVVALLGPNGAGKTTTLRAICGTLPVWQGQVRLDGRTISGRSAYEIAVRGLTLIPEGRGIFPGLDVRDNIAIGANAARGLRSDERSGNIERVLLGQPIGTLVH